MTDPPSALSLAEAMRAIIPARRSNPAAPWTMAYQAPEQEQPWRDAPRPYGSRREALDAARDAALAGDLPAGTVVRIERAGTPKPWLAAVDRRGALCEANKLPKGPPPPPSGVTNWLEVWEGDRAEGPWMLFQCARVERPSATYVERPMLVLALCACVRTGLRTSSSRGDDVLASAVATAERWAMREESDAGARRALAELRGSGKGAGASDIRELAETMFSDTPGYYAHELATYVAIANDRPSDAVRRSMAADVRRFVSLGMVLLSQSEVR